jgi:chemotaxis protein MotB
VPPREKKPADKPKQEWMLTYGDVVTLLLTFFVLLLAMSSMDQSFISRVSIYSAQHAALARRTAGKAPRNIQMVLDLVERPWEVFSKEQKIKDLLFPDNVLPPEIDRNTLNENLRVLARNEGVALIFSDKLLFAPGGAELTPGARAILAQVAPLILHTSSPVNVAGFTDAEEGRAPEGYALSGERASSVLDYFLTLGMEPLRFSLSAYGPNRPLSPDDDAAGRAKNRRVEVFLKTNQALGGYLTQ